MSGQFITNEKQLLSEVMEGIYPFSDKLYFLVGFFYFSGFEVSNFWDEIVISDSGDLLNTMRNY